MPIEEDEDERDNWRGRFRPPDDDDDGVDEHEGTDPRDIARFDGDTISCPKCGHEIYAEANRCPHCKHLFIDIERIESHRHPLWFRLAAWICILLFTWWMVYVVGYFLIHWWQS